MKPGRPGPTESDRADALARDALRLAERGDLDAAERVAEEALSLAPNNPAALRVSGAVLRRRGRFELAEGCLRVALAIDSGDALARRELAACLADQGQFAAAIALLPTPSAGDSAAWFELSVLHDRNSDASSALATARRVTRLAPRHPGAQFLAARALTALGRVDEAADQYRQLARLPGQGARAWFSLLDLKTVRISPDELSSIEALAEHPRASDEDRMLASFALGQAYEMANRPEDAVRAFGAANRSRRRQTPWDAEAFSRAIDAILDVFALPGEDTDSDRGCGAIFVLGMPRSGTTLVEQILAAHSQVVGASELPDLGQIIANESARRGKVFPAWVRDADEADWRRLGEDYLARTKRWQTRLRFTDKMPENWIYVGAILRMLPGARVIGCDREPLETAWSCYKQLFAPGLMAWSYDFDSIAAYACDSRRLWQHFQRTEPRRCRTQSHEAILADLDSQVRELLAFAGLEYEPACLDFASARRETRSASAAQVRQPLNRETARRERYGSALDALAQALDRVEERQASR